jgi:hypothetical protein
MKKKILRGAFMLAVSVVSAAAFAGGSFTEPPPTVAVPEPGTLGLLAAGVAAAAAARLRKRK